MDNVVQDEIMAIGVKSMPNVEDTVALAKMEDAHVAKITSSKAVPPTSIADACASRPKFQPTTIDAFRN